MSDGIGKQINEDMKLLMELNKELNQVRESHPDWYDYFEGNVPLLANRAGLMELLRTAPTPATRHYIFGILSVRIMSGVFSGQEF